MLTRSALRKAVLLIRTYLIDMFLSAGAAAPREIIAVSTGEETWYVPWSALTKCVPEWCVGGPSNLRLFGIYILWPSISSFAFIWVVDVTESDAHPATAALAGKPSPAVIPSEISGVCDSVTNTSPKIIYKAMSHLGKRDTIHSSFYLAWRDTLIWSRVLTNKNIK